MERNYFEISQTGKPPILVRFKFGKWKRKKDAYVCEVEMQVGTSLKFEKEEGELK